MDAERHFNPIGEMCNALNATPLALRSTEEKKLTSPDRRGTPRPYTDRDRGRLTWILRGKRVGFSLADIRELLDLYDVGDHQRTQMATTLDRCRERITALQRQKQDIDATIEELDSFCVDLNNRLQQQ